MPHLDLAQSMIHTIKTEFSVAFIDFSIVQISVMLMAVLCSYIIFGMIGFGTALIASPVLLQFLPLAEIIPLLALLDLCTALSNLIRDGKKADITELKRLIPLMCVGSLIGFLLLLKIKPETSLLAFAVFILLYALYALSGIQPERRFDSKHVVPFGFGGGLLGAMFGSGGFMYSIYLNGRLQDPQKIRITQTTLIGCSTLLRVILFALAGVYFSWHIFALMLLFIPSMLIGSYVGKHITLKLSKAQFLKIIHVVIFFSGLSILLKYALTHS